MFLCTDGQDACGSIQIGSLSIPFKLKIAELPGKERFKVSINPASLAVEVILDKTNDKEALITVSDQPVFEVRGRMLSLMFLSQRVAGVNAVLLQFLHHGAECP
jgi:hypothetical protein